MKNITKFYLTALSSIFINTLVRTESFKTAFANGYKNHNANWELTDIFWAYVIVLSIINVIITIVAIRFLILSYKSKEESNTHALVWIIIYIIAMLVTVWFAGYFTCKIQNQNYLNQLKINRKIINSNLNSNDIFGSSDYDSSDYDSTNFDSSDYDNYDDGNTIEENDY